MPAIASRYCAGTLPNCILRPFDPHVFVITFEVDVFRLTEGFDKRFRSHAVQVRRDMLWFLMVTRLIVYVSNCLLGINGAGQQTNRMWTRHHYTHLVYFNLQGARCFFNAFICVSRATFFLSLLKIEGEI